MKKTDSRHYNRAKKRLLNLEMTYWLWYKDLELPSGKIDDVFYSGNSVYGSVYVKIKDRWYLVNKPREAYRPRRDDIYRTLLQSTNENVEILINNRKAAI